MSMRTLFLAVPVVVLVLVAGQVAGQSTPQQPPARNGEQNGLPLESLLKALDEAGALNTIAKPTIATCSGRDAQLSIVTEVPYLQHTQTEDGNQVSTISFREVGTSLHIEPTADGGTRRTEFVVLISPRIIASNAAHATVQPAPPTTKRSNHRNKSPSLRSR